MTRVNETVARLGSTARIRNLAATVGLMLCLSLATTAIAQGSIDEPTFRVLRIELSAYGGMVGGDQYLDLPPLLTPLTNDTALDEILDFNGESPSPAVQAPKKTIDSGWLAGGAADFYFTPNFGMRLYGRYGQANVVFKGRREKLVPSDSGNADEFVTVLEDETQIDQTTISSYSGGAGIIYNILSARKHNTRPFVTVGMGGILNQFDNTDDVAALFFEYSLGVGFPIKGDMRGFVSVGAYLYTWETDEVSLDSTLQFSNLQLGLVWRHIVPEPEEELDTDFPADDADSAGSSD